jgi:hypothetical protein
MASSYHRFFHLNTTIVKNDGALPLCPLLFLRHKKEGDGNLLPSPFLFQQHRRRRQWHIVVVCFFFNNTKKKATITSCRCFLRLNTTREEGDGNKLPSPSSLQ